MLGEGLGQHEGLLGARQSRAIGYRPGPPADLNADRSLDLSDVLVVLDRLGRSDRDALAADMSVDGRVGVEDVGAVIEMMSGEADLPPDDEDLPGLLPTVCCLMRVCLINGSWQPCPPGAPLPEGGHGDDSDDGHIVGGGSLPDPGDRDDDNDGIPNRDDCDSQYYTADPGELCEPCANDDGDEFKNQNDCDSQCYEGAPEYCCATQQVTKVIVDLRADTDNDKTFNDADEDAMVDHDGDEADPPPPPALPTERIPYEEAGQPGRIVMLNDDDDDGNGVPDRYQNGPLVVAPGGPPLDDDELAAVSLRVSPNRSDSGTWTLSFNEERIRVYLAANRLDEIEAGAPNDLPAPTWVYVEGVSPSASMGDVDLTLTATFTCQNIEGETSDTARLTVVELGVHDLRAWSEPWLNETTGDVFLWQQDPDAHSMPVGGALADGASICLLRLEPPLKQDSAHPLVNTQDYPLPNMSVVVRKKTGELAPTDVVGTITEASRPPNDGGAWSPTLPPLPQPRPMSGYFQDFFDDGLAFYVPPENYNEAELNANDTDKEKSTLEFFVTAGLYGTIGERPFILRRPPVLLAHGLKSSPATWDTNVWRPDSNGGLATRLYYLDYESHNADGYDTNWPEIPERIEQILAEYRAGIDGVKYAATRIDYVGHSMGGVLARLYVSDVEVHNFPRATGHWFFTIGRSGINSYLRGGNYYAGSIRRFVSIGSPFQGSSLATLAEAKIKGQGQVKTGLALIDDVRHQGLRGLQQRQGLASMPGMLTLPAWSDFPDAYVDLQPNSAMQQLMDTAQYPDGRRRVLWHPIVGRAGSHLQPKWWETVLWGGVFNGLTVAELDPDTSDLVVLKSSARLGQPGTVGKQFDNTVHSGTAAEISGVVNPGVDVHSETSSQEIAAWVRHLLTTADYPNEWQGELK